MQATRFNRNSTRIPLSIILILIALLILFSDSQTIERYSLQTLLSTQAATQIDEALEKNILVFTGISAIKGVIALVEGSTVGVGFNLQLGDLVQPAYDYVDFVWRLFLYTTLLMTFYKQLFESGILGLGLDFIAVSMLLYATSMAWTQARARLRHWATGLLKLGLIIAYGIPAILLLLQHVSQRYTEPLKLKAADKIETTRVEFSNVKIELLSLKNKVSLLHPGESAGNIKDSLLDIGNSLSQSAWNSAGTLLYYVSILLFELLFLPLVMALLLYIAFQFGMKKIQQDKPVVMTPKEQPAA